VYTGEEAPLIGQPRIREIMGNRIVRVSNWLAVSLALLGTNADAIVIRHNQPDALYRVDPKSIPAIVDLPGEGHGTLIAQRWIVTAAHAASSMEDDVEARYVIVNGKKKDVRRVVMYPTFNAERDAWKSMFSRLRTQSSQSFADEYTKAMSEFHDIALLELAEPVTDVAPMPVYWRQPKVGALSDVFGAGATGTDAADVPAKASHRTQLRRATNRLLRTDGPWLRFAFDCSARAPRLSGALAGGDSGGPVTINVSGRRYLAGINHGLDATASGNDDVVRQMQEGSFRTGKCGQIFAAARMAFFKAWIDRTMAGQ
jgi:hypothetical protein